jgi:hypothetical protein
MMQKNLTDVLKYNIVNFIGGGMKIGLTIITIGLTQDYLIVV